MKNRKLRAGIVALALVAGTAIFTATAHGSAPAPGTSADNPIIVTSPDDVPAGAIQTSQITHDDCSTTTTWRLTIPGTDEDSHQEFRYSRDVPAVAEQGRNEWGTEESTRSKTANQTTEYRYRVRDWVENRKEVKSILGWYFVTGGDQSVTVNNVTIPGQWVQRAGWNEIHPAIINAVWGPAGPPDTVLGEGTVNLNVYGGPSTMVQYQAYAVDYSGWTEWTNWSGWSTEDPGPQTDGREVETREVPDGTYSYGPWSAWTERSSGETSEPTLPEDIDTHRYRMTGPVWVVTTPAEEAHTEFFVLGAEPSREEADASWIQPEQLPADQGWQQFDERTVVDEDGTPDLVTYYAYNDGYRCVTDPESDHEERTPGDQDRRPGVKPSDPQAEVPTRIHAGL